MVSRRQYRHWRERFYPQSVRQADWLASYAQRFATVEINATFYRLPDHQPGESSGGQAGGRAAPPAAPPGKR